MIGKIAGSNPRGGRLDIDITCNPKRLRVTKAGHHDRLCVYSKSGQFLLRKAIINWLGQSPDQFASHFWSHISSLWESDFILAVLDIACAFVTYFPICASLSIIFFALSMISLSSKLGEINLIHREILPGFITTSRFLCLAASMIISAHSSAVIVSSV